MWRGSHTLPLSKAADGYNEQIRHLEDIVHLLLTRTEPAQPTVSLAPLTGSFRYSTARGLIPILSKRTASSLARTQSGLHHYLRFHSLTSSKYTDLSPAPQPYLLELSNLRSSETHLDRHSSFSPSATPSSGLQRKGPPLRSRSLDQRRGPPFQFAVNSKELSASTTTTTLSNAVNSLGITENTAIIAHSADDSTSAFVVGSRDLLLTLTPSSSPGSSDCIHTNNPPSNSDASSAMKSKHPSLDTISVEAHDLTSTFSLINPAASNSTTTAQKSPTPNQMKQHSPPSCHSSSDCTPTKQHPMPDDNLSNIVTPPELATAPLAPPESFESKSALSSATTCNSSPICPTAQNCPENLEIAQVGSLAVKNDESVPTDTQIAPEYSPSTLEYYNDIDNYLETSGVNEIKKKKKKRRPKILHPTPP
ncbi:hypothetical protein PGTUg99_010594 [Puccinia graminis f. sp. tritici]|nr:hypothetical protein PGTUg99_010594 [Puccinia graminis f. sp. tritici]